MFHVLGDKLIASESLFSHLLCEMELILVFIKYYL